MFIKQAIKKHGKKYDYSQVQYKNGRTKVKIICPNHGGFYQRPENHARGQGCTKCSGVFKKTTESFIEKARSYTEIDLIIPWWLM